MTTTLLSPSSEALSQARFDELTLVPATPSLEELRLVLVDVELESFGAAKPTDSSCYGAQQPCIQTCC